MYLLSSENAPQPPWLRARTRNLTAMPGVRCGAWKRFVVMTVNAPTCAHSWQSYLAVPLE